MAKKYIVELQKDEQEVVITHKYSPQKGKGAKKRKIGSSQ